MVNKIHPIAAIIATLCIAIFLTAQIGVGIFGSYALIVTVKSLIVMPGLFILIPAIVVTGGTGFVLSKNRTGDLVKNKKKRMPFIAANGILILLPAAIFLDQWASAGLFDTRFYMVQGLELIAGAINLALMSLNMRDGLKLSGKLRPRKKSPRKDSPRR